MLLLPETTKLLAQFDPTSQKLREPDYIFVASASRVEVLLNQFESINQKDPQISKHGGAKPVENISFTKYRHSLYPEEKVMVLVFFTDRILNKEAEAQGLRIQLQDKYQTLPF